MIDRVDPATRSRIMAAIRSKDTKPEVKLRKALYARGFRYRIHSNDLIGRPDIVLRPKKAIIFVNGCFWHGHDCGHVRLPKSNTPFWEQKISRNIERDKQNLKLLLDDGWRVCLVWECALRSNRLEDLNILAEQVSIWINGVKKQATFSSRRKCK